MIKHSGIPDRWALEVDLLAVGSSSGGLTAAIMDHDLGYIAARHVASS